MAVSTALGKDIADLIQGNPCVARNPSQCDRDDQPQASEGGLCLLDNDPVGSVLKFAFNAVDGVFVVCEGEKRMAREGGVLGHDISCRLEEEFEGGDFRHIVACEPKMTGVVPRPAISKE